MAAGAGTGVLVGVGALTAGPVSPPQATRRAATVVNTKTNAKGIGRGFLVLASPLPLPADQIEAAATVDPIAFGCNIFLSILNWPPENHKAHAQI